VEKKKKSKEQISRLEYMLRSVGFGDDGKPEIQLDVPISIRLKRNPVDDSGLFQIQNSKFIF